MKVFVHERFKNICLIIERILTYLVAREARDLSKHFLISRLEFTYSLVRTKPAFIQYNVNASSRWETISLFYTMWDVPSQTGALLLYSRLRHEYRIPPVIGELFPPSLLLLYNIFVSQGGCCCCCCSKCIELFAKREMCLYLFITEL